MSKTGQKVCFQAQLRFLILLVGVTAEETNGEDGEVDDNDQDIVNIENPAIAGSSHDSRYDVNDGHFADVEPTSNYADDLHNDSFQLPPFGETEMEDMGPGLSDLIIQVKVHSGLWRTCVYYDEPGQRLFPKLSPYRVFYYHFFNLVVLMGC